MAFNTMKCFAEVASRYDGFILDQFGVMHNGSHALPGSSECVSKLAEMGKKLIILSNTSSTAKDALKKLPSLGFDPEDFVGAVTSGEEASRFIRETYGNDEENKKKAIWFTWDDSNPSSKGFLELCGNIVPTTNVEEADFVITHGCKVLRGDRGEMVSLEGFMEDENYSVIDNVLEKCLKKRLPMVCANPDFICKLAGGVTGHMPGKIAARYEQMGGGCTYFGKPHAEHFKACLRDLGLESSKVVHVGDSLHHDIAGANASGIDSILISGGIHCEEFDVPIGDLPSTESLSKLFEKVGQIPTHVCPLLRF